MGYVKSPVAGTRGSGHRVGVGVNPFGIVGSNHSGWVSQHLDKMLTQSQEVKPSLLFEEFDLVVCKWKSVG